jgi:hypothetical protein
MKKKNILNIFHFKRVSEKGLKDQAGLRKRTGMFIFWFEYKNEQILTIIFHNFPLRYWANQIL